MTGPSRPYETVTRSPGEIRGFEQETKHRYALDELVGRFLQRRESPTETAADHKDDDDGGADLSGLEQPLGADAAATRFGRAVLSPVVRSNQGDVERAARTSDCCQLWVS